MELFPMFEEHLSVEIREDGTYITMEKGSQGLIKISDFRRELLNANVMNFDLKRIKSVLEGVSSGKPEFVGPPLRFFNEEKFSVLEVKVSPEEAQIWISKDVDQRSFEITMQDVEYVLTQKEIKFGIDWDFVSKFVKRGERDQHVAIAHCEMPVNGEPGRVKEEVKVDKNAKPLIIDGGQADFRNVGEIKQIKKGELIAVRIPPTPGKDGKNIFGEVISATPGTDALLMAGVNTELSEEGNELRAGASGYLYRDKGAICVGLLYIVQEVNFESGNIDYEGDVCITGNVLPDFEVVASGNITIEGQVDSAHVESTAGSVIIKQGVFGKEKGMVIADKDVELYLIQDATVKAGGKVSVKKSMANCKVKSRMFDATEMNCCVISSTIKADEKCEIYQIGNKQESLTKVIFEDKASEALKNRMEQCETLSNKLDDILASFEKRLRSIRLKIKKQHNQDDVDALKSGIDEYTIIQRKKDLLAAEVTRLTSDYHSPKDVVNLFTVKVMYPEIQVEMGSRYGVFNTSLRDVQIKVDGDKIVTVPLLTDKG